MATFMQLVSQTNDEKRLASATTAQRRYQRKLQTKFDSIVDSIAANEETLAAMRALISEDPKKAEENYDPNWEITIRGNIDNALRAAAYVSETHLELFESELTDPILDKYFDLEDITAG